jgi:hypothetical protein
MRKIVVVAVFFLCGLAIWRPSLHDIGIALVILALTLIAGVGRLGIGFVRSPRPASKPDPLDEKQGELDVSTNGVHGSYRCRERSGGDEVRKPRFLPQTRCPAEPGLRSPFSRSKNLI